MEMTESEICREYKEAKDKRAQIRILADMNVCERNDILRILLKNGFVLTPEGKKKMETEQKEEKAVDIALEGEKAKEEPPEKLQSIPDAVMRILYTRMDELDEAIKKMEKEYKEIAAFIGHYGGEIKARTA